jgi:hypothetical protein
MSVLSIDSVVDSSSVVRASVVVEISGGGGTVELCPSLSRVEASPVVDKSACVVGSDGVDDERSVKLEVEEDGELTSLIELEERKKSDK